MAAVADQVAIAMDRKLAEENIRRLNEELEQRVLERTAELRFAVTQLQEEIARPPAGRAAGGQPGQALPSVEPGVMKPSCAPKTRKGSSARPAGS